jgi:hypothetical protein
MTLLLARHTPCTPRGCTWGSGDGGGADQWVGPHRIVYRVHVDRVSAPTWIALARYETRKIPIKAIGVLINVLMGAGVGSLEAVESVVTRPHICPPIGADGGGRRHIVSGRVTPQERTVGKEGVDIVVVRPQINYPI